VLRGGRAVAVSLVAREGGFSPAQAEGYARGDTRVRGHALADTLVVHAQRPEAGTMEIVRSVRIATHPDLRREGLGRKLVLGIHSNVPAALFGTLFGATADIVRFRRSLGYEVVRVGASRGTRSGEPSVVMARAIAPESHALVRALRDDLARDLPLVLELLRSEGTEVGAELAAELAADLPPIVPLDDAELVRRVRRYVESAQPSSATPSVLAAFAEAHRTAVGALPPRDRALVEARLLERRPWSEVAHRAGLASAAIATRAMRNAVSELLRRVG